jgi:hypothetical protein
MAIFPDTTSFYAMDSSEVEEIVSGPSWDGQTIGLREETRLRLQLP